MNARSSKFLGFFLFGVLALSSACGGSGSGGDGDDDGTDTGTVGAATTTIRSADGSPIAGASAVLSSGGSATLTKAAMKNANGHFVRGSRVEDDDGDECDDIEDEVSGTVISTDCSNNDGVVTFEGEIPCGTEITLTVRKGSFFLSLSITFTCIDSDGNGGFGSEDTVESEDDTEFSDDCGQDSDDDEDEDDDEDDDDEDTPSASQCTTTCEHVYDECDLILVDEDGIELSQDECEETCPDQTTTLVDCLEDVACTDAAVDACLEDDGDSSVSALKRNGDDDSCTFESADMAVVTGMFDEIENVLAKLGFGEVDEIGELDQSVGYGFDLIDGTSDSTDLDELLSSVENMNAYDIIFINCGNSFESVLTDATVLANIQDYVEGGGKLYVTDLSYDFVEQPFPSFMDFLGDGTDSATAETADEAQEGTSGISSDAAVNDETMADWLDGVTVNTGSIDVDCFDVAEDDINGTTGARNEDGTVTIADFLSGWAVMDAAHTGVSPTIWISGPIDFSGGSDDNAPLTVSLDQGLGRILYSSYHTAHSCPTLGFWPQERVLQYLVFEL